MQLVCVHVCVVLCVECVRLLAYCGVLADTKIPKSFARLLADVSCVCSLCVSHVFVVLCVECVQLLAYCGVLADTKIP